MKCRICIGAAFRLAKTLSIGERERTHYGGAMEPSHSDRFRGDRYDRFMYRCTTGLRLLPKGELFMDYSRLFMFSVVPLMVLGLLALLVDVPKVLLAVFGASGLYAFTGVEWPGICTRIGG